MIVDTSALLAFFDSAEPEHSAVRDAIENTDEVLVVSAYVVAELDYLVANGHGVAAEIAVLHELSGGAWELTELTSEEWPTAIGVIEKYADQQVGVADAANVVLARRYGTRTIATLDRRHFDVLRPLDRRRFTIVP